MPTPLVKSVSMAGARFARRAGSAGEDYREGVEKTGRSWSSATKAAKASYIAGVQEAAGRNAFEKGVEAAGDAKWRERAMKLGPGRFAEGVAAGQSEYEKNVQPFLDVISRTDLPLRGPTGSEGNYQRSALLGRALRAAKTGKR
jgi:hypothetical protein